MWDITVVIFILLWKSWIRTQSRVRAAYGTLWGYPIYRCGTGVYQRGGGLELWGSVTGGTYEHKYAAVIDL